jgi:hypothetical protein
MNIDRPQISESQQGLPYFLCFLIKTLKYVMGPMTGPLVVHRSIRRGVLTRSFLARLDIFRTFVVIIVFAISFIGTSWYLLSTITLSCYVGLVLVHRGLILHGRFRLWADNDWIFLIRTLLFVILNGVFLFLLYSRTDYLVQTKGRDVLWLSFVFANLSIMRRGRLSFVLFTTTVSWLALAPAEYWRTTVSYELSPLMFLQALLVKATWLGTLSLMLFITLHFLGEQLPAFEIVHTMAREWSQIHHARELAEVVSQTLQVVFGFEEVNVFLSTPTGELKLVSAATSHARQLIADDFMLSSDTSSLNITAYQKRRPIIVNDVLNDPIYKDVFYPHQTFRNVRSEMVVPLMVCGKAIGTLDIMRNSINGFVPYDEQLMLTVAASFAAAMANALNAERLERHRQLLQSLQVVAGNLASMSLSIVQLGDILKNIAFAGQEWSQADVVIVYELEYYSQGYQIKSGPYVSGELLVGPLAIPRDRDNVVTRLAETNITLFADNVCDSKHKSIFSKSFEVEPGFREREHIQSLVALPLWNYVTLDESTSKLQRESRQIIGMILFNYRKRQLIENDQERQAIFLTFADLVALAIQKTRLNTKEFHEEVVSRRFWSFQEILLTHVGRLRGIINHILDQPEAVPLTAELNNIQNVLEDLRGTGRLMEYCQARHNDKGTLPERLEWLQTHLKQEFPNKSFYFDVTAQLEFSNLPLETVDHLYAIAFDTISRSLVYGQAQIIWLQLYSADGLLHLVVENDGRGFDTGTLEQQSTLVNLERRSSLINGHLSVDASIEREGAVISVTVPLTFLN